MLDESAIRVTAAQKKAVLSTLSKASEFTDPEAFVTELAASVLTAEDTKTKWVVVTRDPANTVYVFGPYATAQTARKVIDGGYAASVPNTTGGIFPLIPAPKKPTTTTKTTKGNKEQ